MPLIREETRDEVASVIKSWSLAFDQAVHLEGMEHPEEESLPVWDRLVLRLDSRQNRQWRQQMAGDF